MPKTICIPLFAKIIYHFFNESDKSIGKPAAVAYAKNMIVPELF